ncbi:SDR family oxidoreductase [Afipia carboxidovorans]|nr:SDR family oxidoreductase [Afipia carboxidovorans]
MDEKARKTQEYLKPPAKSWGNSGRMVPSENAGPVQGKEMDMKIVVIGGSGLIGKTLVSTLREKGHEALAASPRTGVNAVTREGLAEALSGAQVVVDVANSPSFEERAVLEFFETSSRNLLAAGIAAGVTHHVILSVVGAQRVHDSGYLRAKAVQEKLVKLSGLPFTILQATQFFEFVDAIIEAGTENDVARLSPALMQPIAAREVANALAEIALNKPLNSTVEIAGPEPIPLDALARQYLAAKGDPRAVIADVHAKYFGAQIDDTSLTPGAAPRLGTMHFQDWLDHEFGRR